MGSSSMIVQKNFWLNMQVQGAHASDVLLHTAVQNISYVLNFRMLRSPTFRKHEIFAQPLTATDTVTCFQLLVQKPPRTKYEENNEIFWIYSTQATS